MKTCDSCMESGKWGSIDNWPNDQVNAQYSVPDLHGKVETEYSVQGRAMAKRVEGPKAVFRTSESKESHSVLPVASNQAGGWSCSWLLSDM